ASISYRFGETLGLRAIGGISLHVWDLHHRAAHYRTARRRVLPGRQWEYSTKNIQSLRASARNTGKIQYLAHYTKHRRKMTTTQPHRTFSNRIEYWLNIRR